MGKGINNYADKLITYNLSYDFLYETLKIRVKESIPCKDGFYLIDEENKKYLIVKVEEWNLDNIDVMHQILHNMKSHMKITPIYKCDSYRNYFFDKKNNDYYVVFSSYEGQNLNYQDISLEVVSKILNKFYSFFVPISLKKNYSFKDFDQIAIKQDNINLISKILEMKNNRTSVDHIFLDIKDNLLNELEEIRSFFSLRIFKIYCKNYNNLNFIHGGLSKNSFIKKDDDIVLGNFIKSSIDLYIKDIAYFIEKLIFYRDFEDVNMFLKSILKNPLEFKIIKYYLKLNKPIYSYLSTYYIENACYNNSYIESKIISFSEYDNKIESFLKRLESNPS